MLTYQDEIGINILSAYGIPLMLSEDLGHNNAFLWFIFVAVGVVFYLFSSFVFLLVHSMYTSILLEIYEISLYLISV